MLSTKKQPLQLYFTLINSYYPGMARHLFTDLTHKGVYMKLLFIFITQSAIFLKLN